MIILRLLGLDFYNYLVNSRDIVERIYGLAGGLLKSSARSRRGEWRREAIRRVPMRRRG
jgi:hypothetical protein